MEHHNKLHVGIDVSKQKLDVAFSNRTKVETFPYTKQGIKQLLSSLKKSPDAFICLEATGGWERALLCSFHENGFEVAVVNPRDGVALFKFGCHACIAKQGKHAGALRTSQENNLILQRVGWHAQTNGMGVVNVAQPFHAHTLRFWACHPFR